MIKNDRQYQITRAEVRRFAAALDGLATEVSDDPLLREVEIAAVRSQLDSLRAEVREYEALRNHVGVIEVDSFTELPNALIKARIASGLSHRQLADRLGMREQQIQRYESTDYSGASLRRIQEVANALGVTVRNELQLTGASDDLTRLRKRLITAGLDREFIDRRLLPKRDWRNLAVPDLVARVGSILRIPIADLLGDAPLRMGLTQALTPSFKIPPNASDARTTSYVLFARHLADIVVACTPDLVTQPIPNDWQAFRSDVIDLAGTVNFEAVLRYLWSRGIAVIPLAEPGGFHAAYWRIGGRDVIVLKQSQRSSTRWLFDLLHEAHHAATTSDDDWTVVENDDDDIDASDDEEINANSFAGNVVLDGQAEALAGEAVDDAGGRLQNLKAATRRVAARRNVDVGSLANYLAWRLALQGESWWGTAHNLQAADADPWSVTRDQLLVHIDPARLNHSDYELLGSTLEEVDT